MTSLPEDEPRSAEPNNSQAWENPRPGDSQGRERWSGAAENGRPAEAQEPVSSEPGLAEPDLAELALPEATHGSPSAPPPHQAEPDPAGDWPLPPAQSSPADGQYAPWSAEPPRVPLPIGEPPHYEEFHTPPEHPEQEFPGPLIPEPGPQFRQAVPPPPERIPNFGHLCILAVLLVFGLLCTGLVVGLAIHRHAFGVTTKVQAVSNIHYTLGSEALLYLFTLGACVLVFPLIWHKGFFAGVQWNVGTALRLRWRLVSAAGACFLLAFIDSVVAPGPKNAPIDRIFRQPGAAWLLFVFGITCAPFFEELFFRGFLLPALCTAYDWFSEKTTHRPPPPLLENGHPQWSFPAMVAGSVFTSLPFAALHAQQTGYSWGPFVLLVAVSLVLCAIRLSTRSLASSVLVHASYNFMLFFIMLVGTHGFRHLNKM